MRNTLTRRRVIDHERAPEMKCFLVEDSNSDALFFTDVLESSGHSITRFVNGAAFLEALPDFKQSDFTSSVLILDMVMPKTDGVEVVRALSERGLKIPTILVSAQDVDQFRIFKSLADALGIPLLGHFQKPVSREKLLSAIDEYESGSKPE